VYTLKDELPTRPTETFNLLSSLNAILAQILVAAKSTSIDSGRRRVIAASFHNGRVVDFGQHAASSF
jgi:hypothetical protein